MRVLESDQGLNFIGSNQSTFLSTVVKNALMHFLLDLSTIILRRQEILDTNLEKNRYVLLMPK
jgi:hypothetical protein